jgi:outer membrane protein assembly factor BamB
LTKVLKNSLILPNSSRTGTVLQSDESRLVTARAHTGPRRRRLVVRAVVVLAVVGAVMGATPAGAPAALSNIADDTWMTNGPVRAIARSGNIIWIGGQFTELRENPPGKGGQVISVSNLAAIDATTGAPVPGLAMPPVTGSIVYALAVADGKLFIGGSFTAVGGASRRNLAAINATSGALDTSFKADMGVVWTLATDSSKLYAGGSFTSAKGQPRTRLAAYSFDGVLDSSWKPSADERPRDMIVAPDGGSIFVVGHFSNVAGPDGVWKARDSVARLDTSTGAVQPWVAGCPCSIELFGLGVDIAGSRVYVGMGGSDWVASYDLTTGQQMWRTDTNGQAQDVAVMGTRLIVAGHFKYVAPGPGGYNCYSNPGTCFQRLKLAALDLNGFLDRNWAPPMTFDYDGVWRVLPNASHLYAVGEFDFVSGVAQAKFARFTDT